MRQAYKELHTPVLVEDVSLEFVALGRLPGTLVKWFQQALSHEELCRMLDGKDRSAVARCVFGYFDGVEEQYFEGSLPGVVAEHPTGAAGFGWDPIFIPEGFSVTRAELSPEDDEKTYRQLKPLAEIKTFLL